MGCGASRGTAPPSSAVVAPLCAPSVPASADPVDIDSDRARARAPPYVDGDPAAGAPPEPAPAGADCAPIASSFAPTPVGDASATAGCRGEAEEAPPLPLRALLAPASGPALPPLFPHLSLSSIVGINDDAMALGVGAGVPMPKVAGTPSGARAPPAAFSGSGAIEDYVKLGSVLGVGQYGVVYRGEAAVDGELVAVKKLEKTTKKRRTAFFAEATYQSRVGGHESERVL